MSLPRIRKEEAFALFAIGYNIEQVAQAIKANRRTIERWKEADKWDERSEQIRQKLNEEVQSNVLLVKKRQLKITQGLQGMAMQRILTGELKLTSDTVLNAMKHELLLLGEPSERIVTAGESPLEKAVKEAFKPDEVVEEQKRALELVKNANPNDSKDKGQPAEPKRDKPVSISEGNK